MEVEKRKTKRGEKRYYSLGKSDNYSYDFFSERLRSEYSKNTFLEDGQSYAVLLCIFTNVLGSVTFVQAGKMKINEWQFFCFLIVYISSSLYLFNIFFTLQFYVHA